MANKPKCSTPNCERDSYSKGLCSGCYGKEWRLARKEQREMVIPAPLQLSDGAIEGEIVDDKPQVPETHLTATSPAEMQMAQGSLRQTLEDKLTVIEREIIEANAALNEARRNGWGTSALVAARNRLVDDETYYNKVLAAVDAGYTIIPDFPVEIFAIRRGEGDYSAQNTFNGVTSGKHTYLSEPAQTDCAPAGAGEYRNPEPETWHHTRENRALNAQERGEPRYYTEVHRTGRPVGPIFFPSMTARSPLMKATAGAMAEKTFDQIGVCLPVEKAAKGRVIKPQSRRRSASAAIGDPLVIGQVVHKAIGGKQKVVSFIIAWHLNLNEL